MLLIKYIYYRKNEDLSEGQQVCCPLIRMSLCLPTENTVYFRRISVVIQQEKVIGKVKKYD